jgi:large subunit ribosomal protein L21
MLVQSKLGPVEVMVFDHTYSFELDEHGRYVVEVWDPKHLNVLLSVVHYRVVDKDPQPLVLTSIEPTTAVLGDPDLTLRCLGTGFARDAVIVFGENQEPIVYVSSEEVTTVVKPSLGWGAVTLPVLVMNGDMAKTDSLDFTFTDPAGATQASATTDRPDPIPVTEIGGVGATTAAKLESVGITDCRQIAAWTDAEAQAVDDKLGLSGRILRDDWIGQAKALIG